MLKNTIKYLLIPAIALILTAKIYDITNGFLTKGTSFGKSENVGKALIGGEFLLTNQNGESIKDTDYRGKLMLVYFGFTNCPDVCPTDLARITEVMKALGDKADNVQPIFITVDPERDTVEKMKEYAANFYPKLQALTGSKESIEKIASAYKVFHQKAEDQENQNYSVEHSAYIYLMGKDGQYITHFKSEQGVDEIARLIGKHF